MSHLSRKFPPLRNLCFGSPFQNIYFKFKQQQLALVKNLIQMFIQKENDPRYQSRTKNKKEKQYYDMEQTDSLEFSQVLRSQVMKSQKKQEDQNNSFFIEDQQYYEKRDNQREKWLSDLQKQMQEKKIEQEEKQKFQKQQEQQDEDRIQRELQNQQKRYQQELLLDRQINGSGFQDIPYQKPKPQPRKRTPLKRKRLKPKQGKRQQELHQKVDNEELLRQKLKEQQQRMGQVFTREGDDVYIQKKDYYGRYKDNYGNLLAVEKESIHKKILELKNQIKEENQSLKIELQSMKDKLYDQQIQFRQQSQMNKGNVHMDNRQKQSNQPIGNFNVPDNTKQSFHNKQEYPNLLKNFQFSELEIQKSESKNFSLKGESKMYSIQKTQEDSFAKNIFGNSNHLKKLKQTDSIKIDGSRKLQFNQKSIFQKIHGREMSQKSHFQDFKRRPRIFPNTANNILSKSLVQKTRVSEDAEDDRLTDYLKNIDVLLKDQNKRNLSHYRGSISKINTKNNFSRNYKPIKEEPSEEIQLTSQKYEKIDPLQKISNLLDNFMSSSLIKV